MFAIDDPAAFFESEGFLDTFRVIGVIGAAYLVVMWIALVLWTYRDISERTTAREIQAASVMLVTLFFVPGLLLYITARPNASLVDSYNRQLEAEAFLQEIEKESACPECRRAVLDSYHICPYCKATLQAECAECGRTVKREWSACPYCGGSERRADPAVRQVAPERRGFERYPAPATRVAS